MLNAPSGAIYWMPLSKVDCSGIVDQGVFLRWVFEYAQPF